MEVHHHSHSAADPDPSTLRQTQGAEHRGRKKWTHYFWEFLMLFLAVFCGFLAENQREHYVENQREKQFMKTLLQDLKNDTVNFNMTIRTFQNLISRFDSLKSSVKNPVNPQAVLNSYKASTLVWNFSSFNYSDRTIEQLRNAGNFRLIRIPVVSDSLIEYDKYIRNLYIDIENIIIRQHLGLADMQNEIFDYDIYSYLHRKGNWEFLQTVTIDSIPFPLKLVTDNKDKLILYYNSLGRCRVWWQRYTNHSEYLRNFATSLMVLIKKEYHLK